MMRQKNILFEGAILNSQVAGAGRALLRVTAGLALALAHGLGKIPPSEGFISNVEGFGFPAPLLFAWLSATAEVAGGFLLALGLLTRPAALLIVINMTVAFFLAHAGGPFGEREKALLFGVIALFYLLAGAGRYSLDAVLRNRRRY